jgi:hypothetical protein
LNVFFLRRGNPPEKEILEFLGVRVKLNFPGFVDRNSNQYNAFHSPTPARIERQKISIKIPKKIVQPTVTATRSQADI